jgi:DNA-binding CsgD family transcriptional regulator
MAAKEYFDCCENSRLTLHEARIVSMICLGLARKDICDVLNIKMSTLGGEITTIFNKTRTGSSADLLSMTVRVYFDKEGNYIHNRVKKPLFAAEDEVSQRFATSAAVARKLGK